jgi:hypothetical protein
VSIRRVGRRHATTHRLVSVSLRDERPNDARGRLRALNRGANDDFPVRQSRGKRGGVFVACVPFRVWFSRAYSVVICRSRCCGVVLLALASLRIKMVANVANPAETLASAS